MVIMAILSLSKIALTRNKTSKKAFLKRKYVYNYIDCIRPKQVLQDPKLPKSSNGWWPLLIVETILANHPVTVALIRVS